MSAAPDRGLLHRFWPPGIAGQLAILIVVTILTIHAVLALSFMLASAPTRPHPAETTGRQAAIVEMVDRADPTIRPAIVAAAREAFPGFHAALAGPGATFREEARRPPPVRNLSRLLGRDFAVTAVRSEDPRAGPAEARLLVRLRDGTALLLSSPRPAAPPGGPGGPLALTIGFLAVSSLLLGTWAVLALTKPLRGIARAVEAFGPGDPASPLPETGPREIRTLARAINRMQERITRLVDDRTRTLAAVGHDLRTPITRLKLRAEQMPEGPERSRMIADLDQMAALVQSALTHLRDGRSDESLVPVDLRSLVQTVADSFADMGHAVAVSAPDRIAVRGRPLELERAVTNIVDNAVKYGGGASVTLARAADAAVIDIADEGPGIPAALRAAVLEPFVRGEAARSMNEHDGFGLGLTIARAIVEAHGGTIRIMDRQPRGLVVRLTLPRA